MRNNDLSHRMSTLPNSKSGILGYTVDPDDCPSTITYYDDGETLASEEIFTSILNGSTSSAILHNQDPCNAFFAINITCTIVFGVRTTRLGTMLLSYSYVRRAFRLLALEMVSRDEYAEVEFELEYDGEKMGEGFVRLAPVLGNGTSGSASERGSLKRRGNPSAWSVSRRCEPRDVISAFFGRLLFYPLSTPAIIALVPFKAPPLAVARDTAGSL